MSQKSPSDEEIKRLMKEPFLVGKNDEFLQYVYFDFQVNKEKSVIEMQAYLNIKPAHIYEKNGLLMSNEHGEEKVVLRYIINTEIVYQSSLNENLDITIDYEMPINELDLNKYIAIGNRI